MRTHDPDKSAAKRTTFVQFSQQEFEDWLDSLPEVKHWRVHHQYPSVYVLPLSKRVSIEIQSTVTRLDEAKSYAKASMQMRLVSLMTSRVLNRKAQGKSHFKRTKNWRTNLHKGVKGFKAVYEDSAGFYEALAELKPGKVGNQEYQNEWLARIESVPGWVDHDDLSYFHKRIKGGGIMPISAKEELEEILANPPVLPTAPPAPKPTSVSEFVNTGPSEKDLEFVAKLRRLWRAANASSDSWYKNISADIGKKMKEGRMGYLDLTQRQLANLEKGFRKYRIASESKPARTRQSWAF